jgi:hypothetical protein
MSSNSYNKKLAVKALQYHRNGINGAPFHAVVFHDPEVGLMIGVVFEQSQHVAVFKLDLLADGVITFGVNS